MKLEPIASPRSILVVDDNEAILQMLGDVLEDEGFTVHLAPNGQAALAMAADVRPDLILTDLMLPEMDGRVLFARLLEHPRTMDIPVVLMSAAGRAHGSDRFAGFLSKPFSIDALLDELVRHLP